MQKHVPINIDEDRTTLAALPRVASPVLTIVGLSALAVAAALGWRQDDQLREFSASYLVSFSFFLSISLGALFFVLLQHLVKAGWSVTVRRLAEVLAANTLCMAVLFLPILVPLLAGQTGLYAWSDPARVEADALLQWKTPYLNVPFFAVRALIYFAVWIVTARFFLAQSTRQDDSGDPALTRRMEKGAGVALILFGLTVTFAAFDWLMSLDPTWFSTIYGLYFFSGAVVAFFAAIILLAIILQAGGLLSRSITVEHYHELGKLLLGFIIFWGYMAFSQYLLIWYANIPEESVWYLVRHEEPWAWVSLALLFGHLLIPFLGLLSREMKRRKILLGGWAVWMLVIHWVDLYWLVMPTFSPESVPFRLLDVCCIIAVGSLYLAGLCWSVRSRALVPKKDPRLQESLAFENS